MNNILIIYRVDAVGVKKGLDSSNQILLAGEAEAVSLADIVRSEVLVLQLLVFLCFPM
jgi:hypothetical protein